MYATTFSGLICPALFLLPEMYAKNSVSCPGPCGLLHPSNISYTLSPLMPALVGTACSVFGFSRLLNGSKSLPVNVTVLA